jgi:hypothetical protein
MGGKGRNHRDRQRQSRKQEEINEEQKKDRKEIGRKKRDKRRLKEGQKAVARLLRRKGKTVTQVCFLRLYIFYKKYP